eukprot:500199_1
MSTSNVQWKLGQRSRVKVFTSKTFIPQWVTAKIIHETEKKVCIQFDQHWVDCIDTPDMNAYEWIHKNNDNKIVIKHFNQEPVKYSTLPTGNKIRDCWKKGDKVKIYPNSYSKSCLGKILRIGEDEHGEFLECDYTLYGKEMTKKLDRYSCDIQPILWKSDYHSIRNKVTMPNPINEIHAIFDIKHKKWNEKTQQFETVSKLFENSKRDNDHNISHNKGLIYIESLKQLFAFVDNDIFYCDIKCKNQTSYEWNKLG